MIQRPENDPLIRVSVVVNTVNRGSTLRDTIIGVLAIDYIDFEIIVVNGPSTDNTEDIISEFSGLLKVARCPSHNLSQSRNIGISHSSGEVVAFIDDDAVPHPSWLTALATHYRIPKIAGVGGFTIDRSGRRWQVKKTICDRYGDAYPVSDFFDERQLNRTGSFHYPSLLGTNSSFRRSVLKEIQGFDETFAYFLDETDVCLRIVDAGYQVVYEPEAIVYHKAAESDRRTSDHLPQTLLPSATSKSYFIMRHGGKTFPTEAGQRVLKYREEISRHNKWLYDNGRITYLHFRALEEDLLHGVENGCRTTLERGSYLHGHLIDDEETSFLAVKNRDKLRVVLVSRGYPPQVDAGIARWTASIAAGLSSRGHQVHVITEARPTADETITFESGQWTHRVKPSTTGVEGVMIAHGVPTDIAAWAKRVSEEVGFIKSFGKVVVSFPIWDLEGIACLGDDDISIVMSLHTSYALAKPYKEEWSMRPLYESLNVEPMIDAERRLLSKIPVILANSQAIIDDLEATYKVFFRDRAFIVPHGTEDLFLGHKHSSAEDTSPLTVLFVGRHESRKGFDIALAVASLVTAHADIEMRFAGGAIDDVNHIDKDEMFDIASMQGSVQFYGVVSRSALENLYQNSDIVIMPSRYESFGLVAIEAMSAGKPVIALRVGGLKEVIVDTVDGYLVDESPNSAEEIAKHIMDLYYDRALLRRLSENARESFSKKFAVEIMIDGIETIYKKAAESL